MSSGPQACRDDEDEWDDLQVSANLPNACKWSVYSREAHFAKQGFRELKLKGVDLVSWVQLQVDMEKLVLKSKQDLEDIKKAIALLEKAGYTIT